MTLAFRAMQFAREVHKDQRRKYTNEPYFGHLAEVAGIVAAALVDKSGVFSTSVGREIAVAVAWLHDCVEDQAVDIGDLESRFGAVVASGVFMLSDAETGIRVVRKALSRDRLSRTPEWIQSIKCADLISNTSSIVEHDPKFAVTYLEEKRLLLDVLTKADPRLVEMARSQL
jgi:guanosine-3',5'-bis(diphosphate) 3'-pyrophosphohydrolase